VHARDATGAAVAAAGPTSMTPVAGRTMCARCAAAASGRPRGASPEPTLPRHSTTATSSSRCGWYRKLDENEFEIKLIKCGLVVFS
jgi:hypothetical protein